jgi:hypothetical protein
VEAVCSPQILDNVQVTVEFWAEDDGASVGLCLLCGQPIRSEGDLIPGTSTFHPQR